MFFVPVKVNWTARSSKRVTGDHKPACHYRFLCRVAQMYERHRTQEQGKFFWAICRIPVSPFAVIVKAGN
jgi:hypothetical protein